MRALNRLGLRGLAWSLRRLYCPVSKDALVLEIGSGGNPYYRANILCDAYLETIERFSEKLTTDRPIILARAEKLPFKDDCFDFVIASHVLEHSGEPEKFIAEMQRVGRAGYLEVPDAFMERLTNYSFHMLEITDADGKLFIRKKKGMIQDENLFELFKNKARNAARSWFEKYPFNFHVRYYWSRESGGIKYEILNPEYEFDWEPPDVPTWSGAMSLKTRLKKIALFLFRKIFSQRARNRKIALEKYLVCLNCSSCVVKHDDEYKCVKCGRVYPVVGDHIPDFT